MKCPHCSESISLFAPAVFGPAKPGGVRRCPHCSGQFAITADKKQAVMVALLASVLGFFLLRPIPMVGSALWGVGVVAAVFVVAARLKKHGD